MRIMPKANNVCRVPDIAINQKVMNKIKKDSTLSSFPKSLLISTKTEDANER